jgi:hypothetical protein
MKNKDFDKIEKNAIKMGDKACKEYVEEGALEALKAAARAYNTALRASFYRVMYKSSKKR